eukprot:746391-Hanusia_phi.AAC.13
MMIVATKDCATMTVSYKQDSDRITNYVFDIWNIALQEFTDQYPQFRGMFNSALLDALSMLSIFEEGAGKRVEEGGYRERLTNWWREEEVGRER